MESETPENNETSARVLAMRTRLQEQSIQRGEPDKDWSFITDEFLNKVLAGVVKDLLWYDHVKVLFHRTVSVGTLVILSASLIVVLRSEAPTWVLAVWLTPLVLNRSGSKRTSATPPAPLKTGPVPW